MGWRGIRRDIINAGKRAVTASRKEAERNERARQKALRLVPPRAHYPSAPQGYGPPPGQAYGPPSQGYAPQGYGPTQSPSWASPAQKSGLSAGLLLAMVFGSLLFCGTCSAVLVGASGPSTREASAPARSNGRPPGAMDPVVGPDAPPLPPFVPPPATVPARAAAARAVIPTPAPPAPRTPAAQPAPPSGPRCCDGSPARCTGRGCCSHHGGVCG